MKTTVEVKKDKTFTNVRSLEVNDLFELDNKHYIKGFQHNDLYDNCFCFEDGQNKLVYYLDIANPLDSNNYELIFREVDND